MRREGWGAMGCGYFLCEVGGPIPARLPLWRLVHVHPLGGGSALPAQAVGRVCWGHTGSGGVCGLWVVWMREFHG